MAAGEGQQIMALISKRLRALRKRHNRIAGFEESVSQGKTLNKDQEEIVRSKPIVTALIQELEKLCLPSSPPPPPEAAVPKQICLCLPVHQPTQSISEEMVDEEEVMMSKTDCKISDGLNDGEVSKDETVNDTSSSTCCSSESSQGVTPSPTSEKVEEEEGWTEVVRRRKRAPAQAPPPSPPARRRGRGRQGPSARKTYNRQSKQRPASN